MVVDSGTLPHEPNRSAAGAEIPATINPDFLTGGMKMQRIYCFVLMLLATALLSGSIRGQQSTDWPGWRGADRSDRSSETGLLQKWPSDGPEKAWTFDEAGFGYAGFSVVGDRLYTMGLDGDSEFALCLNAATGEKIWQTPCTGRFANGWGDGPRSTPTVAGDSVYCLFPNGTLVCLKTSDGSEVWKRTMQDLGGETPDWGFSESPLVDGGRVVCTPGGPKGAIAALDAVSGETLWQTSELDSRAHYSSLIIMNINDSQQYVQLLVDKVVGINPDDGKVLWQSDWHGRVAVIPTPVDINGQVYVTSGYNAGSRLIGLDGNKPEIVWDGRKVRNHHGGMILVDGSVYGYSDDVGFVCQKVDDGDLHWNNKEIGKGCCTWADGRFYFVEEDTGNVLLLEANPEKLKMQGKFTMEPQSENRNPRGRIWVHPVVVNGRLYVRDQEFIHCYNVAAGGGK